MNSSRTIAEVERRGGLTGGLTDGMARGWGGVLKDRSKTAADRGGVGVAAVRRDLLFVAMVLLVGLVIGLVDALSVTHDRADAGRPVALWKPIVWEVSSVVVLAALTPSILALTRRALPFSAPWPGVLAAHVAGAAIFSLIHVTAMGAIRWGVYAAVGDYYAPFAPLGNFLYEFRKDLLVYLAVVAIYVAWLRLAKPPPPAPADPDTLEIRDGARRHFIAVDELSWVEAAGNYVELHRGDGPILHRASLAAMERRLGPAGFVRIHRSRLVRRGAITEVISRPTGDYVVRLAGGRELAGSRRYRRPLLEP